MSSAPIARLTVIGRDATPISTLRFARSFRTRLVGLLGRSSITPDEGLFFERSASLHMLGMRFPIAVIWLGTPGTDGSRRVCGTKLLRPWSGFALPPRQARSVLEGHPSLMTQLFPGDRVMIIE